jgi:hypothetical protein
MTKTIDDINLHTWFMDRELDFVPSHFVKSNTILTDESKQWILEKLVGRFAITERGFLSTLAPAFEDPKEALFYELKWG